MGCDKELIRKIAASQPGYKSSKDDKDIADSLPYPDAEKQASIEFGRIKEVFAKHGLSLDNVSPSRVQKRTDHLTAVTLDDVKAADDKPQLHPFMTAPGLHWLIASDPGSGKSTLVWHWMSQLTKQGKVVIHIHGDQTQGKAAARMREMHCDPKLTILLDLEIYDDNGLPVEFTREEVRDEIKRLLKAKGLADKQIGCICIDPGNKIVELLWEGIAPRGYRNKIIAFDETKRDHAHRASGMIFKWFAKELNTSVGVIGHPPKNSDGRNRYPGHVAWEADAEIVYRMWKLSRTMVHNMPKPILRLFQSGMPHQNFRVLSCIKSRAEEVEAGEYNTMLLINEDGSVNTLTVDKVGDKIEDLLPDQDDKYPSQHEYLAAARDHLLKHPHAKMSVTDINKAINRRTANFPYCVGILTIEAMKHDTGISLTSGKRGGSLFIAG